MSITWTVVGISERITTIRALLGPNAGLLNSSSTIPTSGTSSGSGTNHVFPRNEQLGSPIGGNYEAVKRADEDLILSPEIAEQVRLLFVCFLYFIMCILSS